LGPSVPKSVPPRIAEALPEPRMSQSEHYSHIAPNREPKGEIFRSWSATIEFLTSGNEAVAVKAKAEGNPFRIPFTLNQGVESALAFKRFHEIRETNRMALDLFFSHYYTNGSFITQQFTDMVHALEGLHRGVRGGNFIDPKKYKEELFPILIAAIPDKIDADLKQSLEKRLQFGNDLSLRRRLKELARSHDEYTRQIIGKPADFADLIAVLRNKVAHALGSEKTTLKNLMEYVVQLHRAKILFQLEILLQIGFPRDFLKECIRRLESFEIVARNAQKATNGESD